MNVRLTFVSPKNGYSSPLAGGIKRGKREGAKVDRARIDSNPDIDRLSLHISGLRSGNPLTGLGGMIFQTVQ